MSASSGEDLRGRDDRAKDYSFVPDFSWALVGGTAALVICVLLYTLVVTWGGWRGAGVTPGGDVAPISLYFRELAALFLSAFLLVAVTRGVGLRTPREA
jgi:hypothetical protein